MHAYISETQRDLMSKLQYKILQLPNSQTALRILKGTHYRKFSSQISSSWIAGSIFHFPSHFFPKRYLSTWRKYTPQQFYISVTVVALIQMDNLKGGISFFKKEKYEIATIIPTSTFSTTCFPNEQTLVEQVIVMFSELSYWLVTP